MHKQELRELLIVLITLLCDNIENHDHSISFAENTINFDHKYHILLKSFHAIVLQMQLVTARKA